MSNPVTPLGFRVLIKSTQLAKEVDADQYSKLAEMGFQQSTGDEHARRQAGQIWGTIEDMGPTAFTGPDWEGKELSRDKVKIGDKVLFIRYAGMTFDKAGTVEGGSQALYRVCADSDVLAVVNEDITIVEEG